MLNWSFNSLSSDRLASVRITYPVDEQVSIYPNMLIVVKPECSKNLLTANIFILCQIMM